MAEIFMYRHKEQTIMKRDTWIKQKEDKVVNGVLVSKARDSIEP